MARVVLWGVVQVGTIPAVKKVAIGGRFLLTGGTIIWYNGGLDFGGWGVCAKKSVAIFSTNWPIGKILVVSTKTLHYSKILHIPSVEFFFCVVSRRGWGLF